MKLSVYEKWVIVNLVAY